MNFTDFDKTITFVATIPSDLVFSAVYPQERDKEISALSSQKAKAEKFFAWKLLLQAIKRVTQKDASVVKFEKQPSGKWTCDACHFSISHRDGVVAVSLSSTPVGVDIEPVNGVKNNHIAKKILSSVEQKRYDVLPKSCQNSFLTEIWTKKESIFKMTNDGTYSFNSYSADEFFTHTKVIDILDRQFVLSVATERNSDVDVQIIDITLF